MLFLIYIIALAIHLNTNTMDFPVCVEIPPIIFQYFKVSASKGPKICNRRSLKVLKKSLNFKCSNPYEPCIQVCAAGKGMVLKPFILV